MACLLWARISLLPFWSHPCLLLLFLFYLLWACISLLHSLVCHCSFVDVKSHSFSFTIPGWHSQDLCVVIYSSGSSRIGNHNGDSLHTIILFPCIGTQVTIFSVLFCTRCYQCWFLCLTFLEDYVGFIVLSMLDSLFGWCSWAPFP